MILRIAITMMMAGLALPSQAACPQELAVYESADGTGGLDFVANGQAIAMSHEIRILFPDVGPVTAYVQPTHGLGQPEMLLPVNCPQGDVTGEELEACIIYQSVIYSTSDNGQLGELPYAGEDAAESILLPNFANAVWMNPAFGGKGPKGRPAEIYILSGCQE